MREYISILKKKGMSQAEFVSRTGISQSTVSDWKIKKNNPSSDKIMVICKALDISPYELLTGTEDMNNSRSIWIMYMLIKTLRNTH